MRQRRAKTYKKLLQKYTLHFGFREPLQVLLDSSFVATLASYKIQDAPGRLAPVLQASKLKLMVTQCAIAALYQDETHAKTAEQKDKAQSAIRIAKAAERRRCGHQDKALHPAECIKAVLGTANQHRYIVATNSPRLRAHLRSKVIAVPVLHTNETGVIVLEPMSERTQDEIKHIEQAKLGGASRVSSRGAQDIASNEMAAAAAAAAAHIAVVEGRQPDPEPMMERPVRKRHAPKAPNPLSMKKKKNTSGPVPGRPSKRKQSSPVLVESEAPKPKRRKRGKGKASADSQPESASTTE